MVLRLDADAVVVDEEDQRRCQAFRMTPGGGRRRACGIVGWKMAAEKIPDEALVVRGGRNRPEDIERGTATHPSGVTGISVESAVGVSVAGLATAIPHGQVGVTTVGEIRVAGGDVIRTRGRSPHHATLTGLTSEQMSRLLTPTMDNPALRDRRKP